MKKILFVCTGNTCRSPMAAAIANRMLKESGEDTVAESAGIAAFGKAGASENAVEALAEIGIDLSGHTSRQLTAGLIQESSDIYAMSAQIKAKIIALAPYASGKVVLLGYGITDPYGKDITEYRKCRDQIIDALKKDLKK